MEEERTFIHDISGTLAICFLLTDSMEENAATPELKLLKSALEKLENMIKSRREILIKRSPKV